ncbi:MAG: hypothetical protein H0W72_00265 [Planctomycetes bacterium]|nr:hypothetical protein [Planctomycetota bacterium]
MKKTTLADMYERRGGNHTADAEIFRNISTITLTSIIIQDVSDGVADYDRAMWFLGMCPMSSVQGAWASVNVSDDNRNESSIICGLLILYYLSAKRLTGDKAAARMIVYEWKKALSGLNNQRMTIFATEIESLLA